MGCKCGRLLPFQLDELCGCGGGPGRWGTGWTPYFFRNRSVSRLTSASLRRACRSSSSICFCKRLASDSSAFSRVRRRRCSSRASASACDLRRAVSASSSHCARGSATGGGGRLCLGGTVFGGVICSEGNAFLFCSFGVRGLGAAATGGCDCNGFGAPTILNVCYGFDSFRPPPLSLRSDCRPEMLKVSRMLSLLPK